LAGTAKRARKIQKLGFRAIFEYIFNNKTRFTSFIDKNQDFDNKTFPEGFITRTSSRIKLTECLYLRKFYKPIFIRKIVRWAAKQEG